MGSVRGRGRVRGQGGRHPTVILMPWKAVDSDLDVPPLLHPFIEPAGPSTLLPDNSTQFDYFKQIVNQSVVNFYNRKPTSKPNK